MLTRRTDVAVLCQATADVSRAAAAQVLEYIEDNMPPETPLAFGLHPNAEIGFKLREAETFCNSLVQLQPRESGGEVSGACCAKP
jgi:hypothetical protein